MYGKTDKEFQSGAGKGARIPAKKGIIHCVYGTGRGQERKGQSYD